MPEENKRAGGSSGNGATNSSAQMPDDAESGSAASGLNQSGNYVSRAGDDDILLGRGKRSYNHIGNVRFRKMVLDRATAYRSNESKPFRKSIALEIISEVQSKGGKFLKPTDEDKANEGPNAGTWEIVPKAVVLTKVKQSLRDMSANIPDQVPRPVHYAAGHPHNSQVSSMFQSGSAFSPFVDGNSQQNSTLPSGIPSTVTTSASASQPNIPPQDGAFGPDRLATVMQALEQRRAAEAELFRQWQQQQSAADLLNALLNPQQGQNPGQQQAIAPFVPQARPNGQPAAAASFASLLMSGQQPSLASLIPQAAGNHSMNGQHAPPAFNPSAMMMNGQQPAPAPFATGSATLNGQHHSALAQFGQHASSSGSTMNGQPAIASFVSQPSTRSNSGVGSGQPVPSPAGTGGMAALGGVSIPSMIAAVLQQPSALTPEQASFLATISGAMSSTNQHGVSNAGAAGNVSDLTENSTRQMTPAIIQREASNTASSRQQQTLGAKQEESMKPKARNDSSGDDCTKSSVEGSDGNGSSSSSSHADRKKRKRSSRTSDSTESD